jgi:hypothetical protein
VRHSINHWPDRTLESISTAVLVFFRVAITRRMRSSVHICSSIGLNFRVTYIG